MDHNSQNAEAGLPAPLDWQHRVAEFAAKPGDCDAAGATPAVQQRQASAEELAAVTALLDVVSCQSLGADYAIRPLPNGGFAVSGSLSAALVQICVVSLQEISSTVEQDFEFEFWPQAQIDKALERDGERFGADPEAVDMEPIRDNLLDVGRLIYELLAAHLDPYPRAPGVMFEPVVLAAAPGRGGAAPGEEGAAPGRGGDGCGAGGCSAGGKENPFAVLAKLKTRL